MANKEVGVDINEYTDVDLFVLMSFQKENEQEAKAAFNVFRKRHNKLLWQACTSVCSHFKQFEELRDIVFNNTLHSIYTSHSYDDSKGNLFLWIFQIAKRELANALYEINPQEKAVDISELSDFIGNQSSDNDEIQVQESYEAEILKKAIKSLSEREQEILLTYHLYSDGNKHLPDSIIDHLKEKYHTTAPNMRKIKQRATEKVIAYIESDSKLVNIKK